MSVKPRITFKKINQISTEIYELQIKRNGVDIGRIAQTECGRWYVYGRVSRDDPPTNTSGSPMQLDDAKAFCKQQFG